MNPSSKVRVAVLRGGPSSEYDTSLKTGAHVLSQLGEMSETYDPLDIFISKDGGWHREGIVDDPHRILRHCDVVWNALHGSYGEDGQVQRLLTSLGVPFTGSGTIASALSMDKDRSKRLYGKSGLLTPNYALINKDGFDEDQLVTIFRNYLHPFVVRPANTRGPLGAHLADTYYGLTEAVKDAFDFSDRVIVEEYIKGDEVSCLVVEGAKGERIYALLPSGHLSVEENKSVENMAKSAHEILGMRHYSGSNFVITPRKKIYIIETHSLPALHEGSLAHGSLEATGWRHRDFVDHVLKLVL